MIVIDNPDKLGAQSQSSIFYVWDTGLDFPLNIVLETLELRSFVISAGKIMSSFSIKFMKIETALSFNWIS